MDDIQQERVHEQADGLRPSTNLPESGATFVPATTNAGAAELSIHDLLDVIYRKKWIIVLAFVSVFLTTLYFIRQRPDKYMSSTTIYLEPGNPFGADPLSGLVPRASTLGRGVEYYRGIFASRRYLQAVEDNSRAILIGHGFSPQEARLEWRGLDQLTLSDSKHKRFMLITAIALTPLVAYTVDSVAQSEFRKAAHAISQEESNTTLVFIEQQILKRQLSLSVAENRLQLFRQRHGILATGSYGENDGGVPSEYVRLQDSYRIARRERDRAETELFAQQGLLETVEQQVVYWRARTEGENQETRSQARARLRNLARERNQVTDRIRMAANQLELSKLQEKQYESNRDTYESEHPELFGVATEHARLVRATEVQQKIYDMLLQRREELRIKAASKTGGIKIIDLPSYSHRPIPTQARKIVILGAVFGVIFGIVIAFGLEYADTSLKSAADIVNHLGLSVAGSVPSIGNRGKAKVSQDGVLRSDLLISQGNPKSPIAEAYRSLRTNLLFSDPKRQVRSIVVSSAGQSEGKSVTSANLSITFAQMGHRTLLIDADLRRPVQHGYFDVDQEEGLAELLYHDRPLDEMIKPTDVEHLSILTAGLPPHNPAPLLGSERMQDMLAGAREVYDMVIVDSPPVIAVTDAVLLGRMVDGLLLVTRCASTPRGVASHAVTLLRAANVNIFGALLNDVDVSRHYGGYGYYYYYYHYYYGGYYGSDGSE